MKNHNYTFLLFFLLRFSLVFGQSINQKAIPKENNGDTSFWYEIQNETCLKLKLQPLINSTDSFRFRYFTLKQIVDVWTKDGKVYYGALINYTNRFIDSEKTFQKHKKPKVFSNFISIDTATARKLYGFINEIAIIPSEENIKNWGSGVDGKEYIFETSTYHSYAFKTYWTPDSQDSSLIEAKKIKQFIINIETCLDFEQHYKNFFSKLKRGYYINDNIIRRKRSTHAQQVWEKHEPDREYIYSKRDTLNNFWTDTLNKVFKKHKWKYLNQNQMILIFSKHNKLKWIHANRNFENYTERMNFYKDCFVVLRAFRKIRIGFLDAKVSYWKRLFIIDQDNKLLLR